MRREPRCGECFFSLTAWTIKAVLRGLLRRTAVISLTLNPGQEVQNDLILEKYLCHICVLQIVRVFIFICEAEAEFDSNFVCVCVFQCFWRVSVLKYSYISLFFFCLFCCADSDEKKKTEEKISKTKLAFN